MIKTLLLALAVSSGQLLSLPIVSMEPKELEPKLQEKINLFEDWIVAMDPQSDFQEEPMPSLAEIQDMLQQQQGLSKEVITKIITTLRCSREFKIPRKDVLTVIDYSLPSSEKRLWVFSLRENKLLYHTYVSHGITSGELLTNFFSNKYNSKASSIGVYSTEEPYYGREGLSLRLAGLDRGFNDNASGRSVVMHGGWYVDEQFIKRYGRPGRSWGCPALPLDVVNQVINTIKNKSLFVIYYPNDDWFARSRFLNCSRFNLGKNNKSSMEIKRPQDPHEPILFADLNRNNQKEEQEPVVVVSASNYERIFNSTPPLSRMLRRQINHEEYIALNEQELQQLLAQGNNLLNINSNLNDLYFVVPEIIMVRGYYETQMKVLPYGKVKNVLTNEGVNQNKTFTVQFDSRTFNVKTSNYFIRWLGL